MWVQSSSLPIKLRSLPLMGFAPVLRCSTRAQSRFSVSRRTLKKALNPLKHFTKKLREFGAGFSAYWEAQKLLQLQLHLIELRKSQVQQLNQKTNTSITFQVKMRSLRISSRTLLTSLKHRQQSSTRLKTSGMKSSTSGTRNKTTGEWRLT